MRVAFMRGVSLYCFRVLCQLGFRTGGYRNKYIFFSPLYAKYSAKGVIFKFTDLGYFRRFFWILNTVTRYANLGFYFDLHLKGLGFRVRRSRYVRNHKFLRLWLGHSGYKFIIKPLRSSLFIMRKLGKFDLFFFSPFKSILNELLAHLVLFRIIRPYKKVKGLLYNRNIIIMRPSRKVR